MPAHTKTHHEIDVSVALKTKQYLSQQRSVVQATSQIAKTEPGTQLSVTSLQPVHISPEVSQTHTHSNIVHHGWPPLTN